VFARLSRDASHEVGGDERPQHNGVLTGWQVGQNVSVKVDWYQHHWHLTHFVYGTYRAPFTTLQSTAIT